LRQCTIPRVRGRKCLTRVCRRGVVWSSSRRVHSPLWEDLPEASSYARIGSTRVLRGRPRNRLRRNRARGCSRISSGRPGGGSGGCGGDRPLPVPAPRAPLQRRRVRLVLDRMCKMCAPYDPTRRPTTDVAPTIILILLLLKLQSARASGVHPMRKTCNDYIRYYLFYFLYKRRFSSSPQYYIYIYIY